MLSSVLRSARAVQMNIVIIRAFIKLREVVAVNKDLAGRLDHVEARLRQHDSAIGVVVEEIKRLKQQPTRPPRRIGFVRDDR